MDGIYALADPSSAVATINMNDEFNFFGKKAYLMGRTFTAFPPINDAPMQMEIIVAEPEPVVEEEEGSWWGHLALGTAVTAALAGAAYFAFGAVTVATGGAALLLAGVCLAGAAAATATVTVVASYEDAKSGHTRKTSEFVSQLTAGAAQGATTAAMLYGLGYSMPAASAMLGGELTALFSGTILSTLNFTELSAGAGYLLMAAQAIRGGSEIESIVNGNNWLLETIFGGEESTYNDTMTLMDGISLQVILIGLMNPPKKEGEKPGDITKKAMMDTDPKATEGAATKINNAKDLSPQEIESIIKYTGDDYREINRSLRGLEEVTPANQATIDGVKSALDKSGLPNDMTLYRGTSTNGLGSLKDLPPDQLVGKTFTEPGFMSTSTNNSVATGTFQGNMQMTIEAPMGTKGIDVAPISTYSMESEVLLQAGTEMYIKDAKIVDNVLHITVKIID